MTRDVANTSLTANNFFSTYLWILSCLCSAVALTFLSLFPCRDYYHSPFFVISKKGRLQRKGRKIHWKNEKESLRSGEKMQKQRGKEREKGGKKGIDESKSNAKKEEGVLMTNVARALQSA